MLLSGTCIIIHVYPIEYLRSLFRRVCIQENNCKGQVRYPMACHERVLHNYMIVYHGENTVSNTVNATNVWCMMGRWGAILSTRNNSLYIF